MKISILFCLILTTLLIGCDGDTPNPTENCRIQEYQFVIGTESGTNKYNYSGNLVSSIESTHNLDGNTYSSSASLEYDDQDRIVFIGTDDENYVNISYSSSSIQVQTIRSISNQTLIQQYNLNEVGQIIELVGWKRYEYNDDGQLVHVFNIQNSEFLETEFEYDNKQNPFENIPVSTTLIQPDGEEPFLVFNFSFQNSGPNNIISSIYYSYNGEAHFESNSILEYNSANYPITYTGPELGASAEYSYNCN